jgi:hypothetical protein
MKIKAPIPDSEDLHNGYRRMDEIVALLNTLQDGQWLPIGCENTKESKRVANWACGHRKFRIQAIRRRTTVYLRLNPNGADKVIIESGPNGSQS